MRDVIRHLVAGCLLLSLGVWLAACQSDEDARTRQQPAPPRLGEFDEAAIRNVNPEALPLLPEITPSLQARLRQTYARGKALGRNPRVFTKLGDCMTDTPHFLAPLGDGNYVLGEHSNLAQVIARFQDTPARQGRWQQNAFLTPSLAAAGGFNVASPLDPTWSDPAWCRAEESPLACELRVANPAFAVIMFGTNDVNTTDLSSFDFYLRTVISQTLDAGVIPLLSTFPPRPENPEKSRQINQIVVRVAQDYQIPLVNLARALDGLPHRGVNPEDTTHLTLPPDGRADVFTPEGLQYGFNVRNLLTLQALARVLAAVE